MHYIIFSQIFFEIENFYEKEIINLKADSAKLWFYQPRPFAFSLLFLKKCKNRVLINHFFQRFEWINGIFISG